ncbi:MAG: hypothetical protein IJY42_01955 [Clostridia bacterium]|nr:hypothetical protein [Clostridia bacterium]
MIGLTVCACLALLFALVLSSRVRLVLEYATEPRLTLYVLGIPIRLIPQKPPKKGPHSMSARTARRIRRKREKQLQKQAEKKKKQKLEKRKKKLEQQRKKKKGIKEKPPITIPEILELIHLTEAVLKALVGSFLKHLRVRVARLRLVIATGDAATTALAYAAVTQAVSVLYPLFDEIPTLRFTKRADIDISLDYAKEDSEVDLRMDFSLRLCHILGMLLRTLGTALIRGLRFFLGYLEHHPKALSGGHSNKRSAKAANKKTATKKT